MIDRYSTKEMQNLWSDDNKYQKWLDVELAVCEAWSFYGHMAILLPFYGHSIVILWSFYGHSMVILWSIWSIDGP